MNAKKTAILSAKWRPCVQQQDLSASVAQVRARAAILSATESIPLRAVSLTYSISKGMIVDQVPTLCLQSYRGTNYLSNQHDNIVGTHMLHLSFVKRTTKYPQVLTQRGRAAGRLPAGPGGSWGRGGITEGP